MKTKKVKIVTQGQKIKAVKENINDVIDTINMRLNYPQALHPALKEEFQYMVKKLMRSLLYLSNDHL